MNEVVRTRRIEASVDEVWSTLADFGSIARWAPNVDHSCLMTATADGIGAARRIQTGRTTLVERVVEWESASALAYEIEGLPPVVRSVTNRWSVEPTPVAAGAGEGGPASTTVSLTSTIDTGPRPPQQLVAKAVGRRLGAASDEMLTGLDAALTTAGAAKP